MQTAPAMTAALACAPDIPPSPDVMNSIPDRFDSLSISRYFRAAFNRVIVVPWTIPCGPMYM